jgi:hypothetical protein
MWSTDPLSEHQLLYYFKGSETSERIVSPTRIENLFDLEDLPDHSQREKCEFIEKSLQALNDLLIQVKGISFTNISDPVWFHTWQIHLNPDVNGDILTSCISGIILQYYTIIKSETIAVYPRGCAEEISGKYMDLTPTYIYDSYMSGDNRLILFRLARSVEGRAVEGAESMEKEVTKDYEFLRFQSIDDEGTTVCLDHKTKEIILSRCTFEDGVSSPICTPISLPSRVRTKFSVRLVDNFLFLQEKNPFRLDIFSLSAQQWLTSEGITADFWLWHKPSKLLVTFVRSEDSYCVTRYNLQNTQGGKRKRI